MSESEYRDAETLRRLYHDEGMTLAEIGDRFDVSDTTIRRWMVKKGVERADSNRTDREAPHRDESTLRQLYFEEELSMREISERLECGITTVRMWMNRFGIERRDQRVASGMSRRVEYATFLTKPDGYEAWATRRNGDTDWLYVHRLLAVAEFGFDAVCERVVHHANEVKWDNRPDNIELMSNAEHAKHHHATDFEETH